ncbi:multidrug resistance-associated ABC transporter [Panaeolus papilionaceus]|nr:multidrug resistance-associated ABC transporter [Panaeolus papilionaceus]
MLRTPFFVACSTAIFHLSYALIARTFFKTQKPDSDKPYSLIDANGGKRRLAFRVARVLGIFLLLISSVDSVFDRHHSWRIIFSNLFGYRDVNIALTYLYTFLLSLYALTSRPTSHRFIASKSTSLILLATWTMYAYRDLYPLATYGLHPAEGGGRRLWVNIGVLTIIAVIIPLCIPRRYVPVDPKNPMPEPSAEQTASWASFVTFTYLDPLVFLGTRVPHIPVEKLPPLLDADEAGYLTEGAFKHLDRFRGAPDRHVFWGLMRYFMPDFILMNIVDFMAIIFGLSTPIGLNKVLIHLESPNAKPTPDTLKPWFWLLVLFIGPFMKSISEELYLYLSTQVRYRAKAVLMEVVFERGLRIRVGEGGDGSKAGEDEGKGKEGGEDNGKDKKGNLIGRINNAVTGDADNVLDGIHFTSYVIITPASIIISIALLYQILGWSSTVTLALTVLLAPLSGYIGTFLSKYEKVKMQKTDARVQKTSEVVSVLRMVKLFGWERKMINLINETRREELAWLRKLRILRHGNMLLGMFGPLITQWSTYATLTVVMHGDLVPSKIFSSLVLFTSLRYQIQNLSWGYTDVITAKVSLDRINALLRGTELLDAYANYTEPASGSGEDEDREEDPRIGFGRCSFTWSAKSKSVITPSPSPGISTSTSHAAAPSSVSTSTLTPSRVASESETASLSSEATATPSTHRSFTLNIPDDITFKAGKLNVITGPTGCGKTALLMALLGEMHYIPHPPYPDTQTDSWLSLPRTQGVAYAAQESWVLNATIKENVLFGSAFDEERYEKVMQQCALSRDLELFEAGDGTEVGERGLTLSGGQKARLTLARAVYSPAQIILLDDIFAALDVHTSASIAKECFGGDLIKGRTVILITHNLPLVLPMAEFLLTMSSDGTIVTEDIDPISIPFKDQDDLIETELEDKASSSSVLADKETKPPFAADGKLILAEEVAEGKVSWHSFKLFVYGLGGDHPIVFFVVFFSLMFVYELLALTQAWFLGYWGSKYEDPGHGDVSAWYYLTLYAGILAVSLFFAGLHRYYFMLATMRASESIHAKLVQSVLTSTLRWLDQTPTGRILARFTQDTRNVDGNLTGVFAYFCGQVVAIVARFASILVFTPAFFIPGFIVAYSGYYLGNMYLKAQMSTKREMSNALSPMLSHFSASIHGLVSIRAYGAQAAFKQESLKRINHYVRINRPSYNLNRWIGIRIDTLGSVFTTALASYLVYGPAIGAANTGFILSVALSFTVIIYIMVRQFNNLQVESNSLERIQDYLDIDHEPPFVDAGKPPAAWPTSGDLRVENLCARYSKAGPLVLHNLTFHIQSGQRVGVVGRTGSGKSSLTLSLLRCIVTEGEIYYDGLPTSRINLEDLRSNITIIPQTPELLSGTLRQNLDPFGKEDDAVLNDALRSAGLYALQEAGGEAKITLDTDIAGGGTNLSVGQRQILALARAILRRSKLLILDEATSAIDYKTDSIIQTTLRTQLDPDVTVITVAHRLQTIMDSDIIMVLDAGKLVEFDTPVNLLRNASSMLRSMVDNSKDSAILLAMAGLTESY